MNEHIYKKIQVIGTSNRSIENAITNAVSKASNSLEKLRWFEVNEIRGAIDNDEVEQWQVGLTIAFTLNEDNRESDDSSKLLKEPEPLK